MKRALLTAFVVLLALPFASAHYADLTFTVDATGTVTIAGTTNVPALAPGQYSTFTSKDGAHWTLNISSLEELDTFVYSVALPEGAQVNYLSGKNARITTDGDSVVIKGSGDNAPLGIVAQYTIIPPENTTIATIVRSLPIIVIVVLLFLIFIIARGARIRGKRDANELAKAKGHAGNSHAPTTPHGHPAPSYLDGIPERQRAIVKLLRDAGGTLTQRQIELATKLPKSSVSRNVEALRLRGIIEKGQQGMTNTVVLAEKYR